MILLYVVLLMAGGLFGFWIGGSTASLVASSAASFFLLLSLLVQNRWPGLSKKLSLGTLIVLLVIFSYRWWTSAALFPSGIMALLTLATFASILWRISRVNVPNIDK